MIRIVVGDCREVLRAMPAESVQCVVTSPPYYGLRDYGIEPSVWGGDPACEHEFGGERIITKSGGIGTSTLQNYANGLNAETVAVQIERSMLICRCGAWRGISTDYCCPRCGFRWSGVSAPKEERAGEEVTDQTVPREARTRRGRQLFDAPGAKPEYRVPPMAEIASVPRNGLTVASLFVGAGGSSLGYRMAGFTVVYANEFVPAAQDTYRANMAPGTVLDGRDVRLVKPSEILDATGLSLGELDLLDGSPPCQAFSTAGLRERGWGKARRYAHGAEQRNEELFFDYVRIRDGLMPRAFVAENVSGLVKGVAKGFFLEILRLLKVGYRVEARVVDAQWLGVPQQRQRVIFVGLREDLGVAPAFPSPLPWRYSVRDALPWLGRAIHDTGRPNVAARDVTDGPSPAITAGPDDASAGGGPRNHFQVEVVKNRNASFSGRGKREEFGDDEVSPTVMSRRPNLEIEFQTSIVTVVQGPEGDFKNRGRTLDADAPAPAILADMADVTDKPAPCVTAGGIMDNSCHFQVEERLVQGRQGDRKRGQDLTNRPSKTILSGQPLCVEVEVRKVGIGDAVAGNVAPTLDGYAVGEEYDRLNPGQASDKFLNLVRADAGKPCPTVTAAGGAAGAGAPGGVASVCHRTERRKFTILELKRLCSFPDDFTVTGTYAQQWERLGNAVPPVMMAHLAASVRDGLLEAAAAGKGLRGSGATPRPGDGDAAAGDVPTVPAAPRLAVPGGGARSSTSARSGRPNRHAPSRRGKGAGPNRAADNPPRDGGGPIDAT